MRRSLRGFLWVVLTIAILPFAGSCWALAMPTEPGCTPPPPPIVKDSVKK